MRFTDKQHANLEKLKGNILAGSIRYTNAVSAVGFINTEEAITQMRNNHFTDEMIAHTFNIPVEDVQRAVDEQRAAEKDFKAAFKAERRYHKKIGYKPY